MTSPDGQPRTAPARRARNRFGRMEWGGAFGDLGTLIPFVAAYIGVVGLDPSSVLFAFGAALLVAGVYYRTPMPIQPMKAIGAVAAAQAAQTVLITPAAIYAAGLVTGIVWLVLGVSGAAGRIAGLVARPVVVGIILGLGMAFMLQGARMMASDWIVAMVAFAATVALLGNRAVPAMLVLLVGGMLYAVLRHPELAAALAGRAPGLHPPSLALASIHGRDLMTGALFLALPQLPLTLGNAVIAIREENNRLFPDRPITEKGIAVSTGLLNLFGSAVGGVPMCHGAGGMAGHVAFGARTGGAPIILGTVLVLIALFFGDSVALLFRLLPGAVLGVVLFLTGAQLALGSCELSSDKRERFVTLLTAGCAIWNVGLAFVAGIGVWYLHKCGWLRL